MSENVHCASSSSKIARTDTLSIACMLTAHQSDSSSALYEPLLAKELCAYVKDNGGAPGKDIQDKSAAGAGSDDASIIWLSASGVSSDTVMWCNCRPKIVEGRVAKTLKTMALLEQAFIKDTDKDVGSVIKESVAALGENIQIRRFAK